MCALTISSMCVVNSFMFSRGMILNATKLFLFFQREKKPNTNKHKRKKAIYSTGT